MRIAYLILAHKCPRGVAQLARSIAAVDSDGKVFVHYDRSSPKSEYQELEKILMGESGVELLQRRRACRWGGFSLVEASLDLLEAARRAGEYDYFYLLSGSCAPLRPLAELKKFLRGSKSSFIESFRVEWIQGGMRHDRYRFYHFAALLGKKSLTRPFYGLQKRLGIHRELPEGIDEIRFGSQWWCLHGDMVERMFAFMQQRPDVMEFFRRVYIPDESFFQTLAHHLDPGAVVSKSLTYYRFDERGKAMEFGLKDVARLQKEAADKFFFRKLRCQTKGDVLEYLPYIAKDRG